MDHLWGTFYKDNQETEDHIAAETKMRFVREALHKSPYKSAPPYNSFIGTKTESDVLEKETVGLALDDRIVHSAKLMQYAKEMRNLISTTEESGDSQIPSAELPDYCVPPPKQSLKNSSMDKHLSDFCRGVGETIPDITNFTVKQLLSKSVALLLVHTGYETSLTSALSTLADATEVYIKKMVTLLRKAVDEGSNSGATSFPDALERMFYEMRIGSIRDLHSYYQERVIKRYDLIQEECKNLNLEYCSLALKPDELNLDLVKDEEQDDVPEIHFPAVEDGIDELQPSLEPGFQMLHSLEQSQMMESQEDGNAESVSPAQDSYDSYSQKRKRLRT